MIYKFKVWVWLPQVTEIYLSAENDEHAISNFNKLDLKEFSWKDDGMRKSRMTYEVVKDVKVKDTTHRTVDKFGEKS